MRHVSIDFTISNSKVLAYPSTPKKRKVDLANNIPSLEFEFPRRKPIVDFRNQRQSHTDEVYREVFAAVCLRASKILGFLQDFRVQHFFENMYCLV